ncbi:MAG: endonuclease/exonuclease/phosphatase family protein, partial [Bacteroidales bacterium]|nr:endonuclease/exonuclease/phosphatase family protein [Bacteroidales bacterium]
VHIPPDVFWPTAFFGLAYPFSLIINFIFLLLWLFRWKRIVFLPLIVILAGFQQAINTFPKFRSGEQNVVNPSGEILKVMSYNVRAFNIYEWLNDPNTNKGIFNFIRSEHPDIICLQEFYTHEKSGFTAGRYKQLFGETPYHHIEYSFKSTKNTGFGIATFSKYPILNRGVIPFENSANLAIYTDILFHDDTIRIINLHLQSVNLKSNNYAFLDSLKIRYDDQQLKEFQDLSVKLKAAYVKRAEQAAKVSRIAGNSPHPVILCGDLNDTPVSYAYRKTRGKLRDAWVEAGSGLGNTYLGRFSFRIDYIFYDESLKAMEFERVKTRLSDHYPVMAKLLVP